jgi:HAD superfamily hydrolase (TIGR01509 family)
VSRFSAAIFDFGDTLFHSPSGADVLVEEGMERAEAEQLWEAMWLASKAPGELASGRDLSEERHREAWERLFSAAETRLPGASRLLYDRVMSHDRWLPYPDAAPVLAALHERGIRVGVLSNIPSSLGPVFELHGLSPYVDAYVESYRHGKEKPDLELFLTACSELGVPPGAAVMVGDNHVADGAAVLAGLTVLMLPPVIPGAPRGLEAVLSLVC